VIRADEARFVSALDAVEPSAARIISHVISNEVLEATCIGWSLSRQHINTVNKAEALKALLVAFYGKA
jgi:hypothetical protein